MKTRRVAQIVLVLACIFAGGMSRLYGQDALSHWYYRNTNEVNRVRFVGGRFLAMGSNGLLLTSTNGSNWTQQVTGTTANLTSAAYGRALINQPPFFVNYYMVVGSSSTVLVSTNAVNWSVTTAGAVGLNDITYAEGSGQFVAAATRYSGTSDPNVIYLTSGTNWTPVIFSGGGETGPCSAICYDADDDNLVTAVGPQFAYDVWTSYDDGETWTNSGFSDQYVTGIAYGNGLYIIVGFEGIPYESTNGGSSWFFTTNQNIDPYFNPLLGGEPMTGSDIAYGNGIFVVADANSYPELLLATPDGQNWQHRAPLPSINVTSIAYGNNTFVGASSQYGPSDIPPGIYQTMPVNIPIITLTQLTNTNAMNFTISGAVGQEYRLQTSSNFTTWSTLWTYTNTNMTMQYTAVINTNTPQLFYRVISP
jgi:hypothetical protein